MSGDFQVINPTLIEIGQTIVAAAALHGENPLDVASGAMGSRARWLAFAALTEAFPHVYFRDIAKWCVWIDGRAQGNSRATLAFNRAHQRWKWWREDDLQKVKEALARARAEAHSAEPLQILNAEAKGNIGKASLPDSSTMPSGQTATVGFQVGASEGAQPPADAGSCESAPRAEEIEARLPEDVIVAPDAKGSCNSEADSRGENEPALLSDEAALKLECEIARVASVAPHVLSVAPHAPQPNQKLEPVCQPVRAGDAPPLVTVKVEPESAAAVETVVVAPGSYAAEVVVTRPAPLPPAPPKPSPAALALADAARAMQRPKTPALARRIIDHRPPDGPIAMPGDPPPGRREMLQRQRESESNEGIRGGRGAYSS